MKLHDYWRSSSAWRVRIALHWKGVAFDRQVVSLIAAPAADGARGGQQHEASFTALSPLGQVPVLELDASESATSPVRHLTQSLAIVEYLEERYPQPPLLPRDRLLRAHARQLALMMVSGIQPLHNLSTIEHVKNQLGGDAAAWTRHFLARGLSALEAAAAGPASGAFLVGDSVTFADVCLIPQLYVARRFSVELGAYPTLLRAEAACALLPAFVAAHADRQSDRPSTAGP
ncbi:MAG TPA: maleylacetoacetate isomerase [Polyangia bacterium]|jgi:maleylpyruvate isomerase|nr:maleylacetoacetate isomerase [Polyangia bacterium]